MKKFYFLATACAASLGASSVAAQTLKTGQCLTLAELNVALKAEGQRIIMIGDQIENPDRGDKDTPASTGFVVTANDSGSVGYQIRGDKPLAVDQTKFCIGSKLGDIELFDTRDAAAAIPRRAYLGGDFDRVVDEMAQGNSRPMLVAALVPDANETDRLRMPFVIFRNAADKNATLAGKDPSSGKVLSFVSMKDVSYTEVGLQRLAGRPISASRMTNATPAPTAPTPAVATPPLRTFSLPNFPDPTQSQPVTLFSTRDIAEWNLKDHPVWVVLASRTYCGENAIRNETMTLSQGSWSTIVGPTATYCGNKLIYYMGVMPYTEFREQMKAGRVRIGGQAARDFTSDIAYRVNMAEVATIFQELSRRELATMAPRTGPMTSYAAAPTSPIIAGGPSVSDILSAHARSSQKYFGGQLTGTPGEVAYISPWGGYSHYDQRSIRNYGCTMISKAKYRCTYDFERRQVADRDSNYGRFLLAFSKPSYSRNTYTFTYDGRAWNVPELDAENLAYKNAEGNRVAQQGQQSRDAFRNNMEEWNKSNERIRQDGFCMTSGFC